MLFTLIYLLVAMLLILVEVVRMRYDLTQGKEWDAEKWLTSHMYCFGWGFQALVLVGASAIYLGKRGLHITRKALDKMS